MDTQKAIDIIERLKDAYSKQGHSDDIVTALAFAIDSLTIVKSIIDEDGWGEDF